MEQDVSSYFFKYPIQNGFLTFTLGILFILTVYHFLLYFQHKDKLYLLYSGYTFFIILSQLSHLSEGFLYELFRPIQQAIAYPMIYSEIYYILYVLFAIKFLDLKKHLPNWNKWCLRSLYIIIIYCIIIVILSIFFDNSAVLLDAYYYFTIPMTLLGVVLYIPFFKVKSSLKH